MAEDIAELSPLEYATEITVAWLSNPNTRASAEDVPVFLQTMHGAVLKLNSGQALQDQAEPVEEHTPAVTVRKSLASRDHIISLIDGKPYKTLKRHLSTHGLTPVQYRERYGLKADYPMVALAYAETRRELAKKIGLGRKLGQKPAKAKPIVAEAKPDAEPKPAAAAKRTPAAKPVAEGKRTSTAKPAAAKPPRKKLGVQFGDNGTAPADKS